MIGRWKALAMGMLLVGATGCTAGSGSSPSLPLNEVEPNDTESQATVFTTDKNFGYLKGACTMESADFYRYHTAVDYGTFGYVQWNGAASDIELRIVAADTSFDMTASGQPLQGGFSATAASPVGAPFVGDVFLEVKCMNTSATIQYTGGFNTTPG